MNKKGGVLILLIGAVLLAISFVIIVNRYKFKSSADTVTATVSNLYPVSSSDGDGYTYKAEFEYSYKGLIYRKNDSSSSNPPTYSIGESVEIFVNPNDPYDILVNGFMGFWFFPMIIFFIGLVLFSIGVAKFKNKNETVGYSRYQ